MSRFMFTRTKSEKRASLLETLLRENRSFISKQARPWNQTNRFPLGTVSKNCTFKSWKIVSMPYFFSESINLFVNLYQCPKGGSLSCRSRFLKFELVFAWSMLRDFRKSGVLQQQGKRLLYVKMHHSLNRPQMYLNSTNRFLCNAITYSND